MNNEPSAACVLSNFHVAGIPGGGAGRSRITPPKDKDFRNFDYESDFETDEEVGNRWKPEAFTVSCLRLVLVVIQCNT